MRSASPPQIVGDEQEPEFNMDHVALESPFATLRSMGAKANGQINGDINSRNRYQASSDHAETQDPVACGVLTVNETERAVEL